MSMIRDSVVYLLGELFAKALPFLLLPYLTRTFGAAGFGELSYYQTLCALLVIVFGLSQDGAITRYFYVYGRRNLPNVAAAGFAYTAACTLLALLYAAAVRSPALAAAVCAAAAQTVLGVQLAIRQCQKRAAAYTLIQTAAGISTALLTVLLLETTAGAPVAVRFAALFAGNAATALCAYLAGRTPRRRRSLKTYCRSGCYILAFGIPLLLHQGSGFIKGQLDRWLIYQHYPAGQLGVYAAAYQLAAAAGIVLMAVNKAVVPYYYHAVKTGSLNAAAVRRWAWYALALSPLPPLAAAALPDGVFTWFLGAQYAGSKHYICLFLFGFSLTMPYYLLVNYLFYHAQNKLISAISLASAAVYLAVLLITARIGIAWIPLAMIAGNAAVLPLLYYFVRPIPAAAP